MTDRQTQAVAEAICKERGDDPYSLEPGDLPVVDGKNNKGESCHYLFREYTEAAQAALQAIKEMAG